MLKNEFKTQLEFDIYLAEQTIRQENRYLPVSERETLKKMQDKNYKPIFIKEEAPNPNIKPIITNYSELRKPCADVKPGEDIKQIIIELKETLNKVGGLGLSSNQIGYNKKISYCKIPYYLEKTKKMDIKELILINPKIAEKEGKIRNEKEGCLSFPRLRIDTLRYIFITVYYLDENFKEHTLLAQDLESLIIQHEYSHLCGRTIIEDKYKTK
jgi:peptide deformylase